MEKLIAYYRNGEIVKVENENGTSVVSEKEMNQFKEDCRKYSLCSRCFNNVTCTSADLIDIVVQCSHYNK